MEDISGRRNPTWAREELILALDVYLHHDGDVPGKTNQEIEELSDILNRYARKKGMIAADGRFRNTNGVYMKLMNFRRFDPKFTSSGRVGLSRGGKLEEAIWAEFAGDPNECREAARKLKQSLHS